MSVPLLWLEMLLEIIFQNSVIALSYCECCQVILSEAYSGRFLYVIPSLRNGVYEIFVVLGIRKVA
jgi:hypothetical protein